MAYGDGFVNNLLYVFYCDAQEKRKIHFGSCHSWNTDWPIPTIIWSTLCSRHIIHLDSPAISFVRSIQRSYSIALDSLDNAMCRLPNLTPLRVTPFALFRNLIQNFIPPVQDSIQLFGNSLPIHPASSIQMTSDIKMVKPQWFDNHAANSCAGTLLWHGDLAWSSTHGFVNTSIIYVTSLLPNYLWSLSRI